MILPLILIIVFALATIAIGVVLRRRARTPIDADPTCGRCGYNVTGLTTDICPECGSDLRVVGIRRPGERRPMSRGERLFVWSAASLPAAFVVGVNLTMELAPVRVATERTRAIFSHVPGVVAIVRATGTRERTIFGTRRAMLGDASADPPSSALTLTLESANSTNVLTVDRSTGRLQFVDAAGTAIDRAGKLDASVAADWLAAHGYVGDAARDVASAVVFAADEMETPAGSAFLRVPPDASQGVTAHPTFAFRRRVPGVVTLVAPVAFAALVWAIGAVVVARRSRRFKSS